MDGGLRVLVSAWLCLSHSLLVSCSAVEVPWFRSEPVSVLQSRGSVARLRCTANPPAVELSWLYGGLPLDRASLPGVSLSEGSLTISSLQPRHQGVYQCVARLGRGLAVASSHAHVAIAEISDYEEVKRRSLVVQENSSVVIECPLPPSQPPALPRLKVRGDWLEESSGEYLVLPSGNLQILSVTSQHQGMYKCGSYNPVTGETKVQTHGTKLSVKHAPVGSPSPPTTISHPTAPSAVAVTLSQPLTLECVVTRAGGVGAGGGGGGATPELRWLKDGRLLELGETRSLRHANLVLGSVKRSDAGEYRCSVQTEQGTQTGSSYTVTVLEPASLVKGPSDQTVHAGSTARFTCVPRGNPAPNITWLFNAHQLSPASQRLQISGSSLVLTEVTPKDQGVYQCLLDNGIGSVQSSAMLTVQPQHQADSTIEELDAAPSNQPMQSDKWEEPFQTQEDGLGDGDSFGPPINAADKSSDWPTPEAPIIISPPQTHKPDVYDLEWRAGRDGGSPINAYFVKYRKVDELGTVVGSWYTVRVPGSEKTLRLSELEASSLYEVLMVARSTAGEGQPAMLTFRTGKEKTTSSNRNPSKAPVVSAPPKVPVEKTPNTHFGVVIHDRVPEAPDRPTISMATESSVYVTWIPRANGGSPITAFRVEFRRGRTAAWNVAADNISPLKLSVEVRTLEPGTSFKFRVVALNMYGESPPSVPSKSYQVSPASPRYSDRPVAGPHISSTDAISATQILLRWTYTPSSNNNTPIQGFYIYYRPTDSDNDSDYKRDVVEGVNHWHMIGQLQPETSYDIKMQCYNDGGESEYSNVMICETNARLSPGGPSQHPITPPGHPLPDPPSSPGGLLYLIVGCVLGVMVLILLVFIAMCLWRNRQQNAMHKYDQPGYLYQPADMNGHVLEYTALPGGVHGGGVHGGGVHGSGYTHGAPMLAQGCHHLHHKLPGAGLGLLNGSGGLYSSQGHPQDGPPLSSGSSSSPAPGDREHGHAPPHHHHHHNGGGMYTALPQTDSTDCMSCQNLCNNNRCYTKTNGTFSSSTLPLMHRAGPCPQQEGLEMVPLGQVSGTTGAPDTQPGPEDREGGATSDQDPDEDSGTSQDSLCLEVGVNEKHCPPLVDTAEEELDMDSPVVRWDSLGDLDCDEKPGWISNNTTATELIQQV